MGIQLWTNLSFCVAENDSLCDGKGVIQITEGVKLPFFTFHSHKELFDAFQCQLITMTNKQTIGRHYGKVLFEVFATFSSKNNYFFYANKNVTHRLTRILIGSVMNFCVISKISCGRVALNRTTWTHLKMIRIVTLDTIKSTFTADYKPLWVTWLDISPTFAGISQCFQMQEVGFHVSHLPQLLFAWTFFSPYVYLSLVYKNNPFFNLCEFQH